MLLCDAAHQVGGKLYILGGGWTHAVTKGPLNMALGIVIAVPWERTNERLPIQAELLTDDGVPVNLGGLYVKADGQIEVGRPPGVKAGSEINAVLALPFTGIALAPGGYVWQLSVLEIVEARTPFWVSSD
jgi:hypothetical protein